MITFDMVLPMLASIIKETRDAETRLEQCVVNRDLYGRVSLIVPENHENEEFYQEFQSLLCSKLGSYCTGILYETSKQITAMRGGATAYSIQNLDAVKIVDRLTTENDWLSIAPESGATPRFVFYSIKGGVGRSTALAAAAWKLAESGKRVLVMDLDLESPGLSSALLPEDYRPAYGITDWLVEDLHDNGGAILDSIYASSPLSHNGNISVVPAHGAEPGEYIQKLGRAWLPKAASGSEPEIWPQRLNRLITALEAALNPDVILIDSRAGVDEIAAACVTVLGARQILLFAIDNEQTWSGYRLLFEHWRFTDRVDHIRDRLQVVGGLVPVGERRDEYLSALREESAKLFSDELYEEIPAGDIGENIFNFAEGDPSAPHFPRIVSWSESFASMRVFCDPRRTFGAGDVDSVFGSLLDVIFTNLEPGEGSGHD